MDQDQENLDWESRSYYSYCPPTDPVQNSCLLQLCCSWSAVFLVFSLFTPRRIRCVFWGFQLRRHVNKHPKRKESSWFFSWKHCCVNRHSVYSQIDENLMIIWCFCDLARWLSVERTRDSADCEVVRVRQPINWAVVQFRADLSGYWGFSIEVCWRSVSLYGRKWSCHSETCGSRLVYGWFSAWSQVLCVFLSFHWSLLSG